MSDSIVSFEAGNGERFGDLLSERPALRERPRIGLLACGFFEYWRMFSPEFKANVLGDLERIAVRLRRDADVVFPCVVDTLDAADQAGRAFAQADLDLLVVVEGTYVPDYISLHAIDYVPHVPVVMFTTQVEEDIAPHDNYETLMRNSALIGTTQLSATFVKTSRKYDVVVGSISEERPYREIRKLARVRRVAAKLRQITIGMVGHVFRGMFDLENDKTKLRGLLGPHVVYVELSHLLRHWEEVGEEEVRAAAHRLTSRFRVCGPREEDICRSVRVGIAMERLVEYLRLDSLCFLGQHYIEKETGAPARLGGAMMLDRGKYLVASEGDLAGLTMMHVLHWLTGSSPLQAEWGQYDASHNALFLVGHGVGAPSLAVSDDHVTLTSAPEEWGFQGTGVNLQFLLKPGPITMGHFLDTAQGLVMFISGGESLEYPSLPCNEIHALVGIERPVKDYLVEIQRRGATHHVMMAHGDVREELALLAAALGIQSFSA